jgi:hypothetical protein
MILSDKTIEEINRHTDPSSLLALTLNRLKRINTPFQVLCIQSIGRIQEGQVIIVDSVHCSKSHTLIYMIGGKYYSYKYFRLKDSG